MAISRDSSPLVSALRRIVHERHGGSIRAAARCWAIPRSTAGTWCLEAHAPRAAHVRQVAAAERVDLAALVHGVVTPLAKPGNGAASPAALLIELGALAAHPVARHLARLALDSRDPRVRRDLFACREAFVSGVRPRSWRGEGDATCTGAGAWHYGSDRRAEGVKGILIELDARGRAVSRRVVLSYDAASRIEDDLQRYAARIEGEANDVDVQDL